MNDFYFENELRNKVKQNYLDSLQNTFEDSIKRIINGEFVNPEKSFYEIILDVYVQDKYGSNANSHYDEEYEKFQSAFSKESIIEFAKNYNFSEEEITYIKLCISKSRFDSTKYIMEVLLRAKAIEFFGMDCLTRLKDNHLDLLKRYQINMPKYIQLLSNQPFGENLNQHFEQTIEKNTEYYFDERINCGGYALKIDKCVFPYYKNFAQAVTRILEEFPFTRLLGNTTLADNEYLVIYRASNNNKIGHHFIRVDDDGVVREKDGAKSPKVFESWDQSLDSDSYDEAIFAVKKYHQMFDVENHFSNIKTYDFTERVEMAFSERTNKFHYHGHTFQLKKTSNNDIIIVDDQGNFIADVFEENGKCLVDVAEEKKDFVENTHTKFKPEIRNGKLINYEAITGRKVIQEVENQR